MAITIQPCSSSHATDYLQAIVDLHIASIQHDNSLMRFHPPFDESKRNKMIQFWQARFQDKESTILLAISDSPTKTLCGVAQLTAPDTDTGPFRAGIEMLMVSPSHQRQGIAKELMLQLETIARQKGRTLIRLGTTKGSPADLYLYPKLGYVKIGEVPSYGIEPNTGRLVDGVEYYKHLKE